MTKIGVVATGQFKDLSRLSNLLSDGNRGKRSAPVKILRSPRRLFRRVLGFRIPAPIFFSADLQFDLEHRRRAGENYGSRRHHWREWACWILPRARTC